MRPCRKVLTAVVALELAGALMPGCLEGIASEDGSEKKQGSFFQRHPRLKKAARAAFLSAGAGTGLAAITGSSLVGGAAAGAGRGAGFSLLRTSKTWEKGKEKLKERKGRRVEIKKSVKAELQVESAKPSETTEGTMTEPTDKPDAGAQAK